MEIRKTGAPCARTIVSRLAPGPMTAIFLLMTSSPLVREIIRRAAEVERDGVTHSRRRAPDATNNYSFVLVARWWCSVSKLAN